MKYYASVRLDVRRLTSLKDGDQVLGNRVSVKVVKNKVAPPFLKTEFDLIFGVGIDRMAEVLDLALEGDIIKKSGSFYRYDGSPLAQGRSATIQMLRDTPEGRVRRRTHLLIPIDRGYHELSNNKLEKKAFDEDRDDVP